MFKLHAPFSPAGDQPQAIKKLLEQRPGVSTLLGVTGSGKTYSIAQVIAQQKKPVLILSPNKTLAAQLYEEFSLFFPENKVGYFVSYYDYYQPESYLPAQDLYIPKETKINDELERLRIEATASIINRPDTIIIASVSCIYSLGNPEDYRKLALPLKIGQSISRAELLKQLLFIQYERNDVEKNAGSFQVYGPVVEIQLPYQKEVLCIELIGNTISRISWEDKANHRLLKELDSAVIFPAKHFVTTEEKKRAAYTSIKQELEMHLATMDDPLARERLRTRVEYDLEMIEEMGYCSGIENYSVHFDGRTTGQAPHCLFDFFDDFLLIIDESHIALPQLRGMYAGDAARKSSLIEYGFRLPSARDNRPLKFEEIETYFKDVIFVSATPGEYELSHSQPVVEQIIRPTGLVDPAVSIHPRQGQLDRLLAEIQQTSAQGFRSLVTVMTKKQAEELAHHLENKGLRVCYLHHALKTPERTEILHKLRTGVFECLVGINLLREGLDLPEVALVAIMDADLESFLRDKRSLIQTIGRAARNSQSKVLFFADTITKSMAAAIEETERRRKKQLAYNKEHQITPTSVSRAVTKSIITPVNTSDTQKTKNKKTTTTNSERKTESSDRAILEKRMHEAAAAYDFEEAIRLRDMLRALDETP